MKESLQFAVEYIDGLIKDEFKKIEASKEATFYAEECAAIAAIKEWREGAIATLSESEPKAAQIEKALDTLIALFGKWQDKLKGRKRIERVQEVANTTFVVSWFKPTISEAIVTLVDVFSDLYGTLGLASKSIQQNRQDEKDKVKENAKAEKHKLEINLLKGQLEVAEKERDAAKERRTAAERELDVANQTLAAVTEERNALNQTVLVLQAEVEASRLDASLANRSIKNGGVRPRSPSESNLASKAFSLGLATKDDAKKIASDLSSLRKIIIPKRFELVQKLLKLKNGKVDQLLNLIIFKLCLTIRLPLQKSIIEKEMQILRDTDNGKEHEILKELAEYQETEVEHSEQLNKLDVVLQGFIDKDPNLDQNKNKGAPKSTTPLVQTLKVLRNLYNSGWVLPKDPTSAKYIDENAQVIRNENANKGMDSRRELDTYKHLVTQMLRQVDLQFVQVPAAAAPVPAP